MTVRINGESRLLKSSELDLFVLKHALADPLQINSYKPQDLLEVFRQLTIEERAESAAVLLQALLRHAQCDRECVDQLLEMLKGATMGAALLKGLIEGSEFRSLTSLKRYEVLFAAAQFDSLWVQSNHGYVDLLVVREAISSIPGLIAAALQRGEQATVEKLSVAAGALLSSHSDALKKVREDESLLRRAASYAESGDIEGLYPLIDSAKKSGELFVLITPFVVSALHRKARAELGRGKPDAALSLLTSVEMQRRTPTTHELIVKALQSIEPSYQPVLSDMRVQLMLKNLAVKDEAIRNKYSAALKSQALYFLERSRFHEAQEYIETSERLFPPGEGVDQTLRKRQALSLLNAGENAAAALAMEQAGIEISLLDRISYRIGERTLWISVLILSFLMMLPLLIRIVVSQKRPHAPAASTRNLSAFSSEQAEDPLFVRQASVRDPIMEEYEECLSVLGLFPGASMSEVKTAYRSAVKLCHPDAKLIKNDADPEKFMALTHAYNRIVEIDTKHLRSGRIYREEES